MNRYQIEQMLNGVREDLVAANKKLTDMYSDSKTKIQDREAQAEKVKDLEEREKGLKAQLDALDKEAEDKLKQQEARKNQFGKETDAKNKIINAKAQLIRDTMAGKRSSREVLDALGDGTGLNGGEKILPTTLTTELVCEPFAKNPLRDLSTFTNIMNLEIPRIAFTLDDDDFVEDSETAKELKVATDTIQFGRNKFKVFADITETVLRGTNTNLVATVENALRSGMAKKEKKVALAPTASAVAETSFYAQSVAGTYDIKEIKKESLFKAIKAALADLEDDYSDNSKILMRKSDYYDIIETLANGSDTLYQAQPEQILGAPVTFCDLAEVPVIGDFSYSHFNYDLDVTYESDKNVKTGVTSFVLTGYMDHKIKLKSAFRLATVGN